MWTASLELNGVKAVCGICGYIGQSQDQGVTYQLMTNLFEKTEVRGEDASGVWGPATDAEVLYHKEPCKSSIFVKRPFWESVGGHAPNLLLCHARAASMGVGVPSVNKNNHPFMSCDGTIGLVHNGRIPDTEYRALKKRYHTTSACDSEIVLRIFEAGKFSGEDRTKEFENYGAFAQGLAGMKDIWSYLSLGHMAVAIGETQVGNNRRLWLFRNKHRSLWLADMRSQLGQVFFFSAPQIWREAIDKYERMDPAFKKFTAGGVKLIELPTEEVWLFNTSPETPVTNSQSLRRFSVCGNGTYTAFAEDQIPVPAIPDAIRKGEQRPVRIITDLLDIGEETLKEEPPRRQIGFHTSSSAVVGLPASKAGNPYGAASGAGTPSLPSPTDKTMAAGYPLSADDIDPDSIDALAKSIAEIAASISTIFTNNLLAGGIAPADFNDLKAALEQAELDLTGTLNTIDRK